MLPCDSATHTSSESGGTWWMAASERMRLFPTWGPFPWTRTIRQPSPAIAARRPASSSARRVCSGRVASWPRSTSALPPKATSTPRVFMR